MRGKLSRTVSSELFNALLGAYLQKRRDHDAELSESGKRAKRPVGQVEAAEDRLELLDVDDVAEPHCALVEELRMKFSGTPSSHILSRQAFLEVRIFV